MEPNPPPPPIPSLPPRLAYEVAAGVLKRSRRDLKVAEFDLRNRIRDAVALSFKRKGDGLDPYATDVLLAIGRLAIKVDLIKSKVAADRVAEQAALLNPPANG